MGSELTGILATTPGAVKISRNHVQANGFRVVNQAGLGIDASASGDPSGHNVAYGNDDPTGCDPGSLC